MTFVWPAALAGLLLVPLVAVGYAVLQRRRSRYALRFTNLDLLDNVVEEAPGWRRHVPPVLFLLALTALAVGVARPQIVVKTPEERAAVVLAIDVSTSMEATDVEPTRLAAAQQAAETFLDRAPDELRVGLVSFSTEAQVLVPPTVDHQLVRDALRLLVADGGTAIGDAIAVASRLRADPPDEALPAAVESQAADAPLAVLLLSDGEPSPETLDPIDAAEEAAGSGVRVFTVALGTDEGTVTLSDPLGSEEVVPVPPDRETLSQVAEITGGSFFEAATDEALQEVYAGLGSDIGVTEEEHEVTFLFAAAGGALLLVGGLLSTLWFSRLP